MTPDDIANVTDDPARVYIETDDEARLCGAWREEAVRAARVDADAGMRLVAYLVLCAAMVVVGALVVAAVRMWPGS